MLFFLAIIVGLLSLVLLVASPAIGIIGLVFAVALVITNSQRKRRALDERRHQEILAAMKDK